MLYTEHLPTLKDNDQVLKTCYSFRQESLHLCVLVRSANNQDCLFIYKVMSLQQLRLHHVYSIDQISVLLKDLIRISVEGTEYQIQISTQSLAFLVQLRDCTTSSVKELRERYGLTKTVRASIRRDSIQENPFISQLYRISEPVQVKKAKQVYISKYFRNVPSLFAFEQVNVWTATWNVAGTVPRDGMLDWIPENEADIYILGLQEMDLSTEAYMRYDPFLSKSWTDMMAKRIQMECICTKQLIGMLILVFVKKVEFISELKVESLGSGLMGMVGNKGAVATRFRYKDSYFCFVNSHLAADLLQVERRNSDYKEVSKRMVFPVEKEDVDAKGYYDRNPWVCSFFDSKMILHGNDTGIDGEKILNQMFSHDTRFVSIFDCDHLVWLGDLNYRVTLPDSETRQLILKVTAQSETLQGDGYDFKELVEYDQLRTEKNAKRVFNGFDEGPLTFRPTYKFDMGTPLYDSSEKKRVPAWCDRILWKVNDLQNNPDWLKQVYYKSHPQVVSSDHSPVSSLFQCQVRTVKRSTGAINQELVTLEDHLAVLHRNLDSLENQAREKVEVKSDCWFGNVRVGVVYRREFYVKNTGKVIVRMTYGGVVSNQNNSPGSSKKDVIMDDTFTVHPSEVRILPGEETTVYVYLMTDTVKSLDDILVFYIGNQKQTDDDQKMFVSVTGTVEPSLYSASLEVGCKTLHYRSEHAMIKAKSNEDVSKDGLLKLLAEMDLTPERPGGEYSIPIWLFQMLDFLAKYAILDGEGNIIGSSEHGRGYLELVKEYVRECLDAGTLDSSVISMISNPMKPSIDDNDWKSAIDKMNETLQSETILKSMDIVSRAVYETLLTFLHKQKLLSWDCVNSVAILTPNGVPPTVSQVKTQVLQQIQELGSTKARVIVYTFAFLKSITRGWRPPLPQRGTNTNTTIPTVPKIVNEVVDALMGYNKPKYAMFPVAPSTHHHASSPIGSPLEQRPIVQQQTAQQQGSVLGWFWKPVETVGSPSWLVKREKWIQVLLS